MEGEITDLGVAIFATFILKREVNEIGFQRTSACHLAPAPSGIYPIHAWRDDEGLVHMAEASALDNGTVMEWGQMIGEGVGSGGMPRPRWVPKAPTGR